MSYNYALIEVAVRLVENEHILQVGTAAERVTLVPTPDDKEKRNSNEQLSPPRLSSPELCVLNIFLLARNHHFDDVHSVMGLKKNEAAILQASFSLLLLSCLKQK